MILAVFPIQCIIICGLPYDPCGPPCSMYYIFVVFPIILVVFLYYLMVVFPIEDMVCPSDYCGLPCPIYYLLMVFPIEHMVYPSDHCGLPYGPHGPSL